MVVTYSTGIQSIPILTPGEPWPKNKNINMEVYDVAPSTVI